MFWSIENYVLIIKRRSFLLNSVPDIDFQFELCLIFSYHVPQQKVELTVQSNT